MSGLLAACRPALDERRPVHVVTKGQTPEMQLTQSTFWYLARGQSGRESLAAPAKFIDWLKSYGDDLQQQFREVAR